MFGDSGLNSPSRFRSSELAGLLLLDRYFVWEQECRGAIGELNQVHRPVQIANLTQNRGLFTTSRAPFVVAHRSEQSAMPPRHLSYFTWAHHFFQPHTANPGWPRQRVLKRYT